MKTIFCPCHDNINESINKEIDFLHQLGIETYDFSDFKKNPMSMLRLDAVNLNWYDDINEDSKLKAVMLLIKKVLVLTVFKLSHVRIIYTFHNKAAHDGKSYRENIMLKRFLLKHSDTISILSMKSKDSARYIAKSDIPDKKFFFVGHPLYSSIDTKSVNVEEEELTFLYFGMVRKYKNIELLIRVWEKIKPQNARLVIAGKAIDEQYKAEIEQLSKTISNIELLLDYIPDEELDRLILKAHCIVSPLNLASSMNSGTLIKSMSMGRTIIIPDIDMVHDYDIDNLFVYTYGTEREHEIELERCFRKCIKIYENDKKQLLIMGNLLKENVSSINSDEQYIERYRKLYYGENC